MTIIEPIGTQYHYPEYELNRLAGTLVNDQPTLGKATAALWWWGHRGKNWALYNLLTPNQATCGSSLKTTDGFTSPDGTLSIVETDTPVGEETIQLKVPSFPMLEVIPVSSTQSEPRQAPIAYLDLEPRIAVEPMHIYTVSAEIKADQAARRATSMVLNWYDAESELISSFRGGSWSSKNEEWTEMWVTGIAPENVATVEIRIRWEDVKGGEAFLVDKMILHNSSDVAAWAFPGCGSVDLQAGLRAHLNMVAGIYNPDEFMDYYDICNHLGGVVQSDPADALSRIPHEARF